MVLVEGEEVGEVGIMMVGGEDREEEREVGVDWGTATGTGINNKEEARRKVLRMDRGVMRAEVGEEAVEEVGTTEDMMIDEVDMEGMDRMAMEGKRIVIVLLLTLLRVPLPIHALLQTEMSHLPPPMLSLLLPLPQNPLPLHHLPPIPPHHHPHSQQPPHHQPTTR